MTGQLSSMKCHDHYSLPRLEMTSKLCRVDLSADGLGQERTYIRQVAEMGLLR